MGLEDLHDVLHTPLVLVLCTFGAVGHLFSIAILSHMLNPTNLLLLSMSGSQLVLCVNFLYSTLFKHGSIELCLEQLWSYGWTWSLLASVNLSVLVHILSTFHLLALSIIRHLTLKHLASISSATQWFTYQKCAHSLVIIYAAAILVCGPLYFQSEVVIAERPSGCNDTHSGGASPAVAYRLAFSSNELLQSLNFWIFGSACKLIPCAVVGAMSMGILQSLKKLQEMSARFKSAERDKSYVRTTKLILVILVLFILVELPQGLLAVGQSVYDVPHMELIGDLFDALTLLNSCLIFALFLSMNQTIRSAFSENWQRLLNFGVLRRIVDICRRGSRGKSKKTKGTNHLQLSEREHHLLKKNSPIHSSSSIGTSNGGGDGDEDCETVCV